MSKDKKLEKLLRMNPALVNLRFKLRIIPHEEAKKGFTVNAKYRWIGLDYNTKDVVVIEEEGTERKESKS